MKHEQTCRQQEITAIKTSDKSHMFWNEKFYKYPLKFRIYADFEDNNEIDLSNLCDKTTNF